MITRKEKAEFGKTAQGTIELLNKLSPEMKAEIVKALTGGSGRIMEGIVEDAINNIAATGEVPVGAVEGVEAVEMSEAEADYQLKLAALKQAEEEAEKLRNEVKEAGKKVVTEVLNEKVTLGNNGITVRRGVIFNPLLAGL